MTKQSPSPSSDSSEEGRAFLQARVALFWKVMFFIMLLSSGLGVFGAVAKPGVQGKPHRRAQATNFLVPESRPA